MRLDLLIAGIIILILGLAVSGAFGSLIMAVGILLLLYVAFSGDTNTTSAEVARYIEPEPPMERPARKPREEREPKTRGRNVDRAARELEAWDSSKKANACPNCGANTNPPNARFCAECGSKL